MKNNEISQIRPLKSFRAKIILYSLLSLVYTILTEAVIMAAMRLVFDVSKAIQGEKTAPPPKEILNAANPDTYMQALGERGRESLGGAFFFFIMTLAILVGIVLFIVYFLFLSRRMTGYLNQIVAGIRRMSNGDLTTRIEIPDEDEFALIGNQLNKMSANIVTLMEKERSAEKTKDDLITNVAHDLRTPLTSIIGYLDLVIKNEGLEKETKDRYIMIAYEKAQRLQNMIGELFSFTKAATGEIILKKTEIDIVKLVEQMIEEFYPAFQDAGLEYDFQTDCDSVLVQADGELMARAFSNLIGNAVKYGRDGKIIKIRVHKTKGMVAVSVLNYGEIIPKESLEHIFDRFYRVDDSRSEETGGSGLGLAIAKKVAEMHGGSIEASSGLNGTIFEIRLKL